MHDLKRKHIFGRYRGSVWTIEYQKRTLPHLHLLLFLYPNDRDRLLDPAVVDRFVCAELPRPETDPDGLLTDVVKRVMIHGPCGQHNPHAPYMVTKVPSHSPVCSKRFPKRFNPVTVVREDGYPEYRRRNDRRYIPVPLSGNNGETVNLDNR
jgi:hypothetical protein